MTKTGKIIAAYNCVNDKLPDKRCEMCPYGYGYLDQTGDNYFVTCNTEMIMADAIALLKVQKSRVMTVEEVSAVNGGDVIWIEDRCLNQMVVGIKFQSPSKNCYYIMLIGATRPQPFSKELYNVNWRCWTSRPTDAQREAEAWT